MEQKNRVVDGAILAMVLSFLGGIMDGYSYAVRGGVFATGQTGNLVLVGFGFMNGDPLRSLKALVPIISFWFGIFGAQHLLHKMEQSGKWRGQDHWKYTVLMAEAVLLLVMGAIPGSVLDLIPNTLISFMAAMQFCCFRQFGDNSAYASVFCTGNMRSCAEMFYQGLVLKNPASLRKAFQYSGIIICFLAGAVFVMAASRYWGVRSIWAGAATALAAGVLLSRFPGK